MLIQDLIAIIFVILIITSFSVFTIRELTAVEQHNEPAAGNAFDHETSPGLTTVLRKGNNSDGNAYYHHSGDWIATHSDTTIKYEDLPERTTDTSKLAQHFYVSVRDALPSDENPNPDLDALEDALTYKSVVMAKGGTELVQSDWMWSGYDIGYWRGAGFDGKWFETVTGRFMAVNDYTKWMHAKYNNKYGDNSYVNRCDTNVDRAIREEARPRDNSITEHPEGKTLRYWGHDGWTTTTGVRNSEPIDSFNGDIWYKLSDSTVGCVTNTWSPDRELARIFDGAQHMHNGGVLGGTGVGYDGVERYSEYGFIVDARITLMRLVNARDKVKTGAADFMVRLNSIMESGEDSLDLEMLKNITEEEMFSTIGSYLPEHSAVIAEAKRIADKLLKRANRFKTKIESAFISTDSNPNPDIDYITETIAEPTGNIREYLYDTIVEAQDERKRLSDEYVIINKYASGLRRKIEQAIPSDKVPYPAIGPIVDILEIALSSEDSKRICNDENNGCRQFIGEELVYTAELAIPWLSRADEDREEARVVAAEKADKSIAEYEAMMEVVCVAESYEEDGQHIYYGFAPTDETGAQTRWYTFLGTNLMQGGVNIIDAGGHPDPNKGGWHWEINRGALFYNIDPWQPSRTYIKYWGIDSKYHTHWNIERAPMWYVKTNKPLDGTELTLNIFSQRAEELPKTGHVVSATSPDGPWTIRASFNLDTAPLKKASTDMGHVLLELKLNPLPTDNSLQITDGLPLSSDGLPISPDELFDHDSCPEGMRGHIIASDGRQQLAYSKMIMFNLVHTLYEQEKAGIITPKELMEGKIIAATEGMSGIRGLRGPKGDTGLKGFAGKDGAKGDGGLRGVKGIDGLKGSAGEDGVKGSRGVKGIAGLKGSGGDAGADGVKGSRGVRGIAGLKGSGGDAGADGVKGSRGFKGRGGDSGTDGVKGSRGFKGRGGDPGTDGVKGETGPSNTVEGERNLVIGAGGYLKTSVSKREENRGNYIDTRTKKTMYIPLDVKPIIKIKNPPGSYVSTRV